MFTYDQIRSLNPLELSVYEYVISHKQDVVSMTIRQLAKKIHVSTSTILRFCTKVDLEGFSELKFLLKRELKDNRTEMPGTSVIDSVDEFFNRVNDEKFTRVINKAAELIVHSELIVFFGVSTSGYFAQYGARILANLGLFTLVITDPFQPRPDKIIDPEHVLLVDLSVSGETEQGLRLAQIYHEKKAKVLSITNSSLSTLAKISDVNISYNVHEVVGDNFINLTTQVPLVFILELIMNKSQSLLTDNRN